MEPEIKQPKSQTVEEVEQRKCVQRVRELPSLHVIFHVVMQTGTL